MTQLHNEFKGTKGFKRIINASGYSKDGLQAAFRHEAAFRQLVWLHGASSIAVWCADLDLAIKMILVLVSLVSLMVELLNTGIEAVVDDISLEKRELAKRAKDVGSAAQMIALFAWGILWIMALCD
ncbi:diacylglycerol kinase [Kingella kingae]|uniref:diacylglycerol kinase n=1 Tax=Kingella kingae TaxID=504 RepID=UPI0002F5A2CB|nr:diacylglycerol kinase [Kingella kingae]MDK4555769.1 diacylglycerol kinase [Kingella kingae]MDK4584879.1 diacylglycerol kinase [Kingella kingae]MDK4588871.1 diacylglycerol kinase [Kingella kingae]MDK4610946.1 diacylglycerol kinase [Kingella kingae]MDK4642711.1 diacylglycerol kinase [Kingella kingae]